MWKKHSNIQKTEKMSQHILAEKMQVNGIDIDNDGLNITITDFFDTTEFRELEQELK